MKKIISLILFLLIFQNAYSMEQLDYEKENEQEITNESYFANLPTGTIKNILFIIADPSKFTIKEPGDLEKYLKPGMNFVAKIALVNKKFHAIVNDREFTEQLISFINAKLNMVSPQVVDYFSSLWAIVLATKGAANFLSQFIAKENNNIAKRIILGMFEESFKSRMNSKMEFFLNASAPVNLIITFNEKQGTLLILAVENGFNKDIVELLLQYGADINLTNDENKTALMIAEEKGNKEIIDLLKNHKDKTL